MLAATLTIDGKRTNKESQRIDRRSEFDLSSDYGNKHSIFYKKGRDGGRVLKAGTETCPVCGSQSHKIWVGDNRITCPNVNAGEKWYGMTGTKTEGGFFAASSVDFGLGSIYNWYSAEKVEEWANLCGKKEEPETEQQRQERIEKNKVAQSQRVAEAEAKTVAEIATLLTPEQYHNAVIVESIALNRAERQNIGKRLINAFSGDRAAIKATIDRLEATKILGHASRGYGEFPLMAINTTIDKLMMPGQVATSDRDRKYIWNNKAGGVVIVNRVKATNHRPHMAVPQLASDNPDYIWVVEGFLKAVIAQILCNQAGLNIAVMGVAGNADFNNPNLLKAAAAYGCPLVLVPDWDCKNNAQVFKQLKKTIGLDIYDAVLWTGQGEGVKASIDDLTIAQVQAAELMAPTAFIDRINIKIEEAGINWINLDSMESIEAAYRNEPGKLKLIKSGVGGGKSFYAGEVIKYWYGRFKARYVSSNYRNPTVATIAELPALEGRHVATKLVDGRITIATSLEVATPTIETQPGNCFQAETIALAGQHNLIEDSVQGSFCKSCPMFHACITSRGQDSQGRAFGFLVARNAVIKASHRLAPQSLPNQDSDAWDNPEWQLLIDESTSLYPLVSTEVTIDRNAANRIKVRLMESEVGRSKLWVVTELLDLLNNVDRHGLAADAEIIKAMIAKLDREGLLAIEPLLQNDLSFVKEVHGVDRSDLDTETAKMFNLTPEEMKLAVANAIPTFIPALLSMVNGRGAAEVINGEIKLTTPTQNAQVMLRTGLTLLDGTPNMARLEALFGKENIIVYSTRSEVAANVKITKVRGSKNATQRTKSNQNFNVALVEAIAGQGRKVAVIDRKAYINQYSDRVQKLVAFSESRGSNKAYEAACDTLVIVGGFNANVNAIKTEWAIYCQDCDRNGAQPTTFKEYYQANKDREMEQAIGRLRAVRRGGEDLEVLIIDEAYQGHFDQELYPEQIIQNTDLLHGKARTIAKIAAALKAMIAAGGETTLRAIAKLADCSHTTVANHWAVAWALIAQNETIVDACDGQDDSAIDELIGIYLEELEPPLEDDWLEVEYEFEE